VGVEREEGGNLGWVKKEGPFKEEKEVGIGEGPA